MQRIAALEGVVAILAPAVLGEEKADGVTRPGVLRRLESIEHTTKIGGAVIAIMQIVQTFDLAQPIKHLMKVLFS